MRCFAESSAVLHKRHAAVMRVISKSEDTIMVTRGTILNSKVEQVVRRTFSKCCRVKTKLERPGESTTLHIVHASGVRSGNDAYFTPPVQSLEKSFTAPADFVTAILFFAGHWRNQPVDTD
jgi:hypothetical protein